MDGKRRSLVASNVTSDVVTGRRSKHSFFTINHLNENEIILSTETKMSMDSEKQMMNEMQR